MASVKTHHAVSVSGVMEEEAQALLPSVPMAITASLPQSTPEVWAASNFCVTALEPAPLVMHGVAQTVEAWTIQRSVGQLQHLCVLSGIKSLVLRAIMIHLCVAYLWSVLS